MTMTNDDQRLTDALATGYLVSPFEDDALAGRWGDLAYANGFPAVFVYRYPLGMTVSLWLDPERLDTPIHKLRAQRAFKKALGKGRVAGTIEGDMPEGVIAGIYPEPVARDLAKRMARLTGRVFPIDESLLMPPVSKGGD